MATTVIDRADAPRVNSEDKVLPRPRPGTPAHIIKSDAEAIEVAHRLADKFAEGAALRDREGLLPLAELDAFSQSGLWGINVPKAYVRSHFDVRIQFEQNQRFMLSHYS